MSEAVVGQPYSETFWLDVAGQTFTRASSYVAGSAAAWSPTFTDLGGGWYRYAYTPAVAGVHEWAGSGSTSGPFAINFVVVTAAQADPASALASATLTYVSPFDAVTSTLTVVQGDDYAVSNGRQQDWSESAWSSLNLTAPGTAVTFTAYLNDVSAFAKAVSVVDATTVRLQLTAAETGAFALTSYSKWWRFEVNAVLADATKAKLVSGSMTVST